VKEITYQRAFEIITSSNSKFNWYFKKDKEDIIFGCKNCYRTYLLKSKDENFRNEIILLMKDNNFEEI